MTSRRVQHGRIMSYSALTEHSEKIDIRGIEKSKSYVDRLRKQSESKMKKVERHPLYMSDFALGIYFIIFLSLVIRRYWVLHGVQFLILFYIGDILFSWFLHVKDAREIRRFRSWLLWWARIGLDFATSTVEGAVTHRVMVAYTLNFWNLVGKNYTINWFSNVTDQGRTMAQDRERARIEETQRNQNRFQAEFKQFQTKITGKFG